MKFGILFFFSFKVFGFDHEHKLWDKILKKNVTEAKVSALFDYASVKKGPTNLNLYLKELEGLKEKEFSGFTSDQKLSFWINAYNAYTVKLIVDHYPVKSVKDIKGGGGLFGVGASPWKLAFIKIFDKKLTLNNIEHDTIRKNFNEPLIHFAVNCASMGCPSLRNEAFTADKLHSQLKSGAIRFIKNSNKNSISHKKKRAKLSKIFKWYGADFNKKYGSFLKFLEQMDPMYKNVSTYSIDWSDYGWNLNESE